MTAAPLSVASQRPTRSTATQRLGAALESLERLEPAARMVAQEVLAAVVDLVGEGVDRLLELAKEGTVSVDRLAADELWTALFCLYDVHPTPVQDRVERALESVRPYLGSHHGDVGLVAVDGDIARIRLLGGCDGCGASEQTLRGLIEGTVMSAAPEIVTVELVAGEPSPVLLQITTRPDYTACPFPGEAADD